MHTKGKNAPTIVYFLTGFSNSERTCDKEFIIRRAATNRVLNVLRHWVSKHSQVRATIKNTSKASKQTRRMYLRMNKIHCYFNVKILYLK